MSVQIVRFRTSPEHSAAVADEIATLLAAVHVAAPAALQYVALRETDEPVFTFILELPDGAQNPLPSIPAAVSFRSWLPGQTDEDPTPRSCTVLGRYSA